MSAYWVRIRAEGMYKGAGFRMTRQFVLTAMHCLRDLSKEARLELELPDGAVMHGRLRRSAPQADLALIAIEESSARDLRPAATDWPRPNARWRVTYSPPGDNARLTGNVTDEPYDFHKAEGVTYKGFQLTVEQELKNFQGYSGSPVETEPGHPVVGILMDEQLSREYSPVVTNVLYAASVQEAMSLFPEFRLTRLRDSLLASESSSHEPETLSIAMGRAPEGSLRAADELLRWMRRWEETGSLHESHIPSASRGHASGDGFLRAADELLGWTKRWEETGSLSPAEAAEYRRHILRRLEDRALGGSFDGCS
ncbi:trypsin-like peptidase domain-containing protein [Streptomyces sp. NPDC050534]|uniref:trypsin-like peptidase domain-containing protein n=1 Tax=Streptomyces sp. NPDC050534 TaxID=3365625 RepID=UPI0037B17207